MENRELTNISFKKAMSKVIGKLLKKEAPTPVRKEIDDFETLNSKVFTQVMDEVVESIPEVGYQENTQLLPEVSSSDNGKIPKVIDGEWGLADASNDFVVTFSADNEMNIHADKTLAEIEAAVQAGKRILGFLNGTSLVYGPSNNSFTCLDLDYAGSSATNPKLNVTTLSVLSNQVDIFIGTIELTRYTPN